LFKPEYSEDKVQQLSEITYVPTTNSKADTNECDTIVGTEGELNQETGKNYPWEREGKGNLGAHIDNDQ